MTVTSTSQASYLYATSSIHKTNPTSQDTTTQTTQNVDKMDEMKEKYKDVYTPIPETYSKADEDLQTQKIHEAYPDYVDFRDFLKLVDAALEGPRIQLGQELTPEQEKVQKEDYDQAYEKAYEIVGGEEQYIATIRGVHKIMEDYPVNNFGKDERVHNETELARFTNASVYEGLEQGKTIEEAKIYAGSLRSSFMDTSYSTINFLETLIEAGRANPNAVDLFLDQDINANNNINFNASNNNTMDLRKYGIEGRWESYSIYESQTAMISEIEKKMSQFQFMLNNENLMKNEYEKLDAAYQDLGNNAGYKRWIEEKHMPMMEEGLNIFENYKIYDSIDIKG